MVRVSAIIHSDKSRNCQLKEGVQFCKTENNEHEPRKTCSILFGQSSLNGYGSQRAPSMTHKKRLFREYQIHRMHSAS